MPRFDHLAALSTAELEDAQGTLTGRLSWAKRFLPSGMFARDYAPDRAELAAVQAELSTRTVRVCAECDGRVDADPGEGVGCTCDPADWYDDIRHVQGHPPVIEVAA